VGWPPASLPGGTPGPHPRPCYSAHPALRPSGRPTEVRNPLLADLSARGRGEQCATFTLTPMALCHPQTMKAPSPACGGGLGWGRSVGPALTPGPVTPGILPSALRGRLRRFEIRSRHIFVRKRERVAIRDFHANWHGSGPPRRMTGPATDTRGSTRIVLHSKKSRVHPWLYFHVNAADKSGLRTRPDQAGCNRSGCL